MIVFNIKNFLYKQAFRNKFDIFSNELVRYLFNIIKNPKKDFIQEESNINGLRCEYTIKFNSYISEKYHIEAKFNSIDDVEGIVIIIQFNENFSKNDYVKFTYTLYEVVRHEFEHYRKYLNSEFPNEEYNDIEKKLSYCFFEEIENIKLMRDYILNPTEIEAYARSILYDAKKRKVSYRDVIKEVIDRVLFNNDNQLKEKLKNNTEVRNIAYQICSALDSEILKHYKFFETFR